MTTGDVVIEIIEGAATIRVADDAALLTVRAGDTVTILGSGGWKITHDVKAEVAAMHSGCDCHPAPSAEQDA